MLFKIDINGACKSEYETKISFSGLIRKSIVMLLKVSKSFILWRCVMLSNVYILYILTILNLGAQSHIIKLATSGNKLEGIMDSYGML